MIQNDTIVALSTPPGVGAIALVRLSGGDAMTIADKVFHGIKGKKLTDQPTHTAHFGTVTDQQEVIDEVVATLFRAPNSYTGEDVVEIACHGSTYIQQQMVELLIRKGARIAQGGEFTQRAFLNGHLDLSQAEAVADLIESESGASHATAINQMRGGYSKTIRSLRDELLDFSSMIELELDFSEEEVEFADREKLRGLLTRIRQTIESLTESFAKGNVIKNGVPVVIAGAPNAGKSTLLNALLNEERAIVSTIAGTTRDAIEDEIFIEGIKYRFIDTAGIRQTEDTIEKMGIERTLECMEKASVIIYLLDSSALNDQRLDELRETAARFASKKFLVAANKADIAEDICHETIRPLQQEFDGRFIEIAAKDGRGIEELKNMLTALVQVGQVKNTDIVTNARHYQALTNALSEVLVIEQGLEENLPGDLLAVDVRRAVHELSSIVGEITDDNILGNIFSRFCIGK